MGRKAHFLIAILFHIYQRTLLIKTIISIYLFIEADQILNVIIMNLILKNTETTYAIKQFGHSIYVYKKKLNILLGGGPLLGTLEFFYQ